MRPLALRAVQGNRRSQLFPAPTEMAASLRVPRKLCSFLFFLRVISYISTPGHLRFHYIQSRRTTEYKISVNSPSVRPRICFSRRGSCVLPYKQDNGMDRMQRPKETTPKKRETRRCSGQTPKKGTSRTTSQYSSCQCPVSRQQG